MCLLEISLLLPKEYVCNILSRGVGGGDNNIMRVVVKIRQCLHIIKLVNGHGS